MTKIVSATLFTAAIALAAPAIAKDAPAERSFTRDGVTYVYTASVDGGATVLKGRSSLGRDFRLTVRDGHVTGKSNGVPVSFDVDSANSGLALAAR